MRRSGRLLLASVVASVAIASLLVVAYRQLSLPKLDGRLSVAGLSAPVDVVRDAAGIPHVYAASDDDAWFTLGFVHAQDRLWQMELNRRTAAGRLAEVLGPPALDVDRFLRTMGIARNAAAVVAHLDADTRRALERYAAGVNANLVARRRLPRLALPIEFVLTGAPFPEPWTAADSIGWGTMVAWDLSTNWTSELARMRLAGRLTKRRIDELMPPYPGNPRVDAEGRTIEAVPDAVLDVADYPALYRALGIDTRSLSDRAASLVALAPASHVEGLGSNNWVVSGARTVSGKPLLANDPHLNLTTPSIWYMAHLSAPGLDVVGATLPGLPVVLIGRNARIAWGQTNTGPDTQDLFIEELRERDGTTEVRTPDGWQALETRSETVRVKGSDDVVLTIRASRHGPLVSDVSKAAGDAVRPLGDGYAIAFQWAALDPDDSTIRAGFAIDRANDWASFVAALADWRSPQQNFVYADVDGHIGFIAPGRVPIRKPDNDLQGQVPAPGWDARYDWDGFVPFDRLPRRFDPPEGRIVTANHKVVDDDYRPFLTSEWAAPYRARRIESLLDATARHDVASFAAIQADVRSLAAVRLLPLLVDTTPSNDDAKDAIGLLARWDGTMAADRAEPLIFSTWLRELTKLVVEDELGADLATAFREQRTVFLVDVLSDRDGRSRWCDDVTTPAVETCGQMKTRALDLALADLRRRLGSDRGRWRWDALHFVRAEHRPFSRVPVLAPVFDLEGAVGGDSNTVDVAGYVVRDDTDPFVVHHGPSLREIIDLGDPERSRFMFATGASGERLSPFYANLFDRWTRGESVPMRMRRASVEEGAIGTLHLVP